MTQKWKKDKNLYNAPTKTENNQIKKKMDYHTKYVDNFLECDIERDYESFDRCVWLWNWILNFLKENNKGSNIKKTLEVRRTLKLLDSELKSLEWGRMTVFKNERIDEMIEDCLRLIFQLLNCKDKYESKT